MKRRDFIGGGLVAAGAIGLPFEVGADGRLYGTPGSVSGGAVADSSKRLMLSLGRVGAPVGMLGDLDRLAGLFNTVLSTEANRSKFVDNPKRFLAGMGVRPDSIDLASSEMRLLSLLCDAGVRDAAKSGNYERYFDTLRAKGYDFTGQDSSLARLYEKLLSENKDHYAAIAERLVTQHGVSPAEIAPAVAQTSADGEVLFVLLVNVVVVINVAALVTAVVHAMVAISVGAVVEGDPVQPYQQNNSPMSYASPPALRHNQDLMDAFRVNNMLASELGVPGLAKAAYEKIVAREANALSDAFERVVLAGRPDAHKSAARSALHKAMRQLMGL